MARRKLYFLILSGSLAGYFWIFFNEYFGSLGHVSVCLFKNLTGIPCPSCGVTRSVLSIVDGNIQQAIGLNPLGTIVLLLLLFLPLWVVADVLLKKESCYSFYHRVEHILQKKFIALPLILLVLMNWIWNIYKHV